MNNKRRYRRQPIDPWSGHNLRLIKAACEVTLRKQGLYVETGFNGPTKQNKKEGK